jgi:hypothetical protein
MNEDKLNEWANRNADYAAYTLMVQKEKLSTLFAGKKLVDAGAVVLSVEDAQALDSLLTKFRVGYLLAHGFDEHNKLRIAIEQAGGKNGN